MSFQNRHTDMSDKINTHLNGEQLQQASLKNLLFNIEKLPKEEEAEKFMLLGMLSAYAKNIPEMHENFKKALEVAPADPVIIYNYAQALFINSLYSQAILNLQKLPELNADCCELLGLSCQALGLKGKARQFLDKLDEEAKSCKKECNCSQCGQEAINAVLQSFDEERDIWQSLSTR